MHRGIGCKQHADPCSIVRPGCQSNSFCIVSLYKYRMQTHHRCGSATCFPTVRPPCRPDPGYPRYRRLAGLARVPPVPGLTPATRVSLSDSLYKLYTFLVVLFLGLFFTLVLRIVYVMIFSTCAHCLRVAILQSVSYRGK